jgi:hypothetical protein
MLIGDRGAIHRRLMRGTKCKQISLKKNGRGGSIVEVTGRELARNTELAVNYICQELEDKLDDEQLNRRIKLSRYYKWCTYHDCFGHDVENCKASKKLRHT